LEIVNGAAAITGPYLAGDLIGFTAGLAIAILLLAFTVRAAKLPGTPHANVLVALCALLWNGGGLSHAALLAAGVARESRPALIAVAIQFSGAGAWPVPILAIWRHFAVRRWQRIASRVLEIIAFMSAVAIAGALWSGPILNIDLLNMDLFPFIAVKEFTAYNAVALLASGVVLLFRGPSTSRAVRLSSLIMVLAMFAAVAAIVVLNNVRLEAGLGAVLHVVSEQSVLVVVLGVFFLFSRFRFADLFIRYSVRILMAGAAAVTIAFLAQAPFILRLAGRTAFPDAVRFFGATVCAGGLFLAFEFADQRIGYLVSNWIFRAPDYRAATQRLLNRLTSLHLEAEITAAVEDVVRETLELDGARLIPFDLLAASEWPAAITQGDVVELDRADFLRDRLPLLNVELLAPVSSGGQVSHVLAVSPGAARPGLVTHEVNYLRVVAAQCGARLDAIHREREMVERRSHEALLLQQVTEAELRALRAQINPHFLFNSLNTLANLIVTEPLRAETMTLRLAGVFRYVLAHSGRPLTSIREEMDFLRTYLDIEEARFGDRLQVEIDLAPEVAGQDIPSLILQPIVENALRHGLGPKPGPGHLWISASARDNHVCLMIEDDGVGLRTTVAPRRTRPQGVGLSNVAERLQTLYHDRAAIHLEPRESGGSRVTILIPRVGQRTHYDEHYR
jgi:two-component system, LytTR family, sensor kinase